MPRSLDSDALAAIAAPVTAPGYLIAITSGSATVRYSTRGALDYDGETWTGGGQVTRNGPTDWTLSLPNHDNLVSALVLGDFLDQAEVAIWSYLGNSDPIQAVSVFTGYINQVNRVTTTRVEISLMAVSLGRSWLPDVILAPPLLNHMPPARTAISWGGSIYYLEPST